MYSLLAVPFYDLTRLLGIHPGWSFVAVNLSHADVDTRLHAADEVALLPPLAGG